MNKQSLYIENFKTLYPITTENFDDSLFESFKGLSNHHDILMYYKEASVTYPIGFCSGGLIKDEIITDRNTYYTQLATHQELDYCVNIAMRNLKDCIDTSQYKFVYIKGSVLPIGEFLKEYGNYAMKVNTTTKMIYGNEWQEDNFSHSPFYKSSGDYAQVVGIHDGKIIPLIQADPQPKIASGYDRVNPFQLTFSAPMYAASHTPNFYEPAMIGADYTTPEYADYKLIEVGAETVQLGFSLYVEPNLTEEDRFFILSPDGNFDNQEQNLYCMLYSKGGIEQYLEAFDICYKWMYPIDYLFVNGRKVRHKSEINQPAIKAFKKVRHIL